MNDDRFIKELEARMDAEPPLSLNPEYIKEKLKITKKRSFYHSIYFKIAACAVPVLLLAGAIGLAGSSIFAPRIQYAEQCADYNQVLNAIKAINRSKNTSLNATGSVNEGAEIASDGSDYSSTNVQVEGVDEDDTVKTDGTFIYSISSTSNQVSIIHAGQSPVVTDTIRYDDLTPISLYVSDGRLTVIYSERVYHPEWDKAYSQDTGETAGSADENMLYSTGDKITVETYDISAFGKASLTGSVTADGQYSSSRMIGSHLYLITTYYVADTSSGNAEDYIPSVGKDDTQALLVPADIAIPTYADTAGYTVITAIDTSGAMDVTDSKALLGYTGTVYANTQNIYVAGAGIADSGQKTQIIRYAISDGKVAFAAQGTVMGYLLNQFSMDEYNGDLRVATTLIPSISTDSIGIGSAEADGDAAISSTAAQETPSSLAGSASAAFEGKTYPDERPSGISASAAASSAVASAASGSAVSPSGGTPSSKLANNVKNNIYVLDQDLQVIGSIEGIAPGESIYSVRYVGEMGYVVTYKRTDPLFAVSFSDPSHPKIVGELTLPGFSNYLHPWADGLLLGFGRDGSDSGADLELKFSMFDISNAASPVQSAKLTVGDSATYSTAQANHKAILIDESRGIIGIPYASYPNRDGNMQSGYFLVSYTKGSFSLLGDLKLQTSAQDENSRGIMIGGTLYVVSSDSITWASLDRPSVALGTFKLQ